MNILNITNAAKARIIELLSNAPKDTIALRISIVSGGCSGFKYSLDFATETTQAQEEIEFEGGKIFISPEAIMYMLGTTMDFSKDKLKNGFSFINPNETAKCGCGESFNI